MSEWRERDRAGRHERHAVVLRVAVVEPAVAPRLVSRVVHPSGAERGVALFRARRHFQKRSEAGIVLVVILLENDLAVRKLRLEVEAVRRPAGIERADQRGPSRAIGMNGPDSPENVAAIPLRFERAI